MRSNEFLFFEDTKIIFSDLLSEMTKCAHTLAHTSYFALFTIYSIVFSPGLPRKEFMLPLRVFAIHNSWETWGGEQNRKTATPLSQSYVNLLGTIHFFQTHLYIWYNATHTWKRRYEKREKKGREEKGKKWRELVAYAVQGWS